MFKQEQRGVMAAGLENPISESFITEDERMQQMGYEGDSTNENTHVSETQTGNDNDATGIRSIPLADRKEIDLMDKTISSIGETNADLFNPELNDEQFISASTPAAFKTYLLTGIKTSGINPILAFGAKRLAMSFVSGATPRLAADQSITLPLDFAADRPDLVKLKAGTAYTGADATTKTEAEAALAGKQAFRITTYKTGAKQEVLVEGLGTATARGNAGDGNTLLTKHNIKFVDNAGRDGTTETDEVAKAWTEEERQQVRSAFAILPDTLLATIAGMELQRAEKDQDDAKAHNDAVRLGKTPPDPKTAAEYGSGKHSLTVYDWGFKNGLNLYGDTKSGFTNGLQATIAHEVGHAIDRNPTRLALNASNAAVETSNAASAARNAASKDYTNKVNKLGADSTANYNTCIDNYNILQVKAVEQYNSKKDQMLSDNIDDLNVLFNGGTTSTGVTVIGLVNYETATDRSQFVQMATLLKGLTALPDQALVAKTAELFPATYDSYQLYKSTDDFRTSVINWENNGGTKPTIPANIDQASSISYLNAVQSSINSKADMDAKRTAYNNSRTVSGYAPGENTKNENTPNYTKGDFRAAAAKDFKNGTSQGAVNRMTDYGDTSWMEFFAESFASYFTDPERFSALRPNLYTYFEKSYGMWKDKYPVVQ